MKKIAIPMMLILVLLLGACSQSNAGQNASQPSNSSQAPESTTPASNSASEPAAPKTDFPTKTIEWVLPFNPGGTSDTSARVIAGVVSKYLPNNPEVIIVHKPGANATVGVETVHKAEPDGYTIGTTNSGPMNLQPQLGKTSYDPNEFEPILKYMNIPRFFILRADVPWNTLEEVIAFAKENPGKFKVGDAGGGADSTALGLRRLADLAGVELNIIPYNGGGPATTALLGGHVDALLTSPANMDPNEIKLLFTFASERTASNPDVPTLSELGFDVAVNEFYGLLAPQGTPKEIVQILHDAFKQALEDPETVAQMEKLRMEISYDSAEGFQKLLADETERVKSLLPYAPK